MRHWNRRVPPPRKLNAWDAGAVSAHVTCENGGRDTFPAAQKANSVNGREGGLDTDQHSFPPDPYQEHARGQELATRDPRARRPMPANTGLLRRAPARRAGRDAPAPVHEPGHPNLRTPHYSNDTPATEPARHGTIRHTTGRQTKSTSTAPPSKSSTLGLPWGARGCTEGD